jgi:hypothetical protein
MDQMETGTTENAENRPSRRLQVIDGGNVAGSIPPFAKKPIRNVGDARRMLARLIHGFQCGKIDGAEAKTLCYLLISYSQIVKDHDFEERIRNLEAKAGRK